MGRFSILSTRGNKYVVVINENNSNHIHGEPIKSLTAAYLTRSYKKVHKLFTLQGLQPKLHILDNECSNMFKHFMTKVDENFQFVPPHLYQRNVAEILIQTFKNHLISGLSSVKKDSPMHIWCQLIPQACLVLNLLQQSINSPKLLAYAKVHGAYDFNATHIAHPGARIVVHKKTIVPRSWSIQGFDGWYLGQARHHYRCFEVFSHNTEHSRIADTVNFFASLYHSFSIISRQRH